MTDPYGIYIHIPFCHQRCGYCGFYAVGQPATDRYVDALLCEMEQRRERLGNVSCDTVYFGGGTPSTLTLPQLTRIMNALRENFSIAYDAEITMEMNPSDMSESYLQGVYDMGINRLSVGVQTHDDRLLRGIGRLHTAKEAERAVRRAYDIGFHNMSIDLMYELPRQSVRDFEKSLLWAVHLPITHVSVYSLIIEEKTYFSYLLKQGKLKRPNEDESWAMYQAMCRILPHYGFRRYEVSSFARRGYESKHNRKYWILGNYIGFGPAASSRIGRERIDNLPGVRLYEKTCLTGKSPPRDIITLSRKEEMEEYAFLHLRMREGMNRDDFQVRYGVGLEAVYGEVIEELKKERLLAESEGYIYCTYRGIACGNYVFQKFLCEEEKGIL